MPRTKLHFAGPQQRPLCNRQLVRRGSSPQDSLYIQGTLGMNIASAGEEVTCRHCLRAAGLIPPIGRRAYDPDEADLAMTDDELLAALMEGSADE